MITFQKICKFFPLKYCYYLLPSIALIFIIFLIVLALPILQKSKDDDNSEFDSNLPLNWVTTLETRKLYDPGFSYSNPNLCTKNGTSSSIKLLILIPSPSHQNSDLRQAIRETWGHWALRQDIALGFFLGTMPHKNSTLLEKLVGESEQYNDLIISNCVDTYDNLTLKSLSILEWTQTFCSEAKYLLKTDDDTWVNMLTIFQVIQQIEGDNGLKIYGNATIDAEPYRDTDSKFYLSRKQYPDEKFPTYFQTSYLIPVKLVKTFYEMGLQTGFLRMEDVFLTGVVAERVGVERVDIKDFLMRREFPWRGVLNEWRERTKCELGRQAILRDVDVKELFNLWSFMAPLKLGNETWWGGKDCRGLVDNRTFFEFLWEDFGVFGYVVVVGGAGVVIGYFIRRARLQRRMIY